MSILEEFKNRNITRRTIQTNTAQRQQPELHKCKQISKALKVDHGLDTFFLPITPQTPNYILQPTPVNVFCKNALFLTSDFFFCPIFCRGVLIFMVASRRLPLLLLPPPFVNITQHHTLNITHSTSHAQHHTLNITHPTSNTQHHTLNITHPTSHAQHHTLNITHSTSNTQHYTSNTQHYTLDITDSTSLTQHHSPNITHSTSHDLHQNITHPTSHIQHHTFNTHTQHHHTFNIILNIYFFPLQAPATSHCSRREVTVEEAVQGVDELTKNANQQRLAVQNANQIKSLEPSCTAILLRHNKLPLSHVELVKSLATMKVSLC